MGLWHCNPEVVGSRAGGFTGPLLLDDPGAREAHRVAPRDGLEKMQKRLDEGLKSHERDITRIEADAKEITSVVSELADFKKEVEARTKEAETKMSMALGEMQDGVGKRLDAAEKELGGKAASADLRKLSLELEAYAKREDIQRIQDMATRVHKDAVERLDDLSERTFTLRADMGEKAGQLQAETDAMGKQEDEPVEGASALPEGRAPSARLAPSRAQAAGPRAVVAAGARPGPLHG